MHKFVLATPPRQTARPRVLLAPIAVTPTKPLTPSHIKCLLWVDVMYKATSRICDVRYLYGHTIGNACQQTLGFWEYLDRTVGDTDYSQWSEEAIGDIYVKYQAEPERAPYSALVTPPQRAAAGWASDDTRDAVIAAAIETDRIEFSLQPVVSLPQRKAKLYEALARVRLDAAELLSPAEFLPVAERLPKAKAAQTRWVMTQALKDEPNAGIQKLKAHAKHLKA